MSHHQSAYDEAGLMTAAGPVGSYISTRSDWEDYDYSASGQDGYSYYGPSQGPLQSNFHNSRWAESEAMDWSSDNAERGTFGPGGEEGTYESHESYLDRWDYSGSQGSSSTYYRPATGASGSNWTIDRSSSDGYRYSGWDEYGYEIADTGSFTEDGDAGYYTHLRHLAERFTHFILRCQGLVSICGE